MKKSRTAKITLSDGKIVEIKCVPINSEIRLESQKFYSKAFAFALENDFPLKAEYERTLRRKGLFNFEDEEKQVEDIQKEIKKLSTQLWSARKPDGSKMTKQEGRELALKIKAKRDSISEITSTFSDMFSNTAEQYASNEQLQYLLYSCIMDVDTGERYWHSFESYKSDLESGDNPVIKESMNLFIAVSHGVDENYQAKLPENSWLIKMGFMNGKCQFIDTQGRLVDSEGRLINSDGRFIDENGNFIDSGGNPVDKDGNPIFEDGWTE